MKTVIRIAMLMTWVTWGTIASSAHVSALTVQPQPTVAAADDNMTPYRTLATDTLTAFKAHDMALAKKKAKALEAAWDKDQKALQKKSVAVWTEIDKAMDDFIKPLSTKSPDAAKVQTTYDTFIAKLQLAVKGAQ